MKHLEAVSVCVDYGDLLKLSIPFNRHLFDKWVIVTSPDDKETQDLCKYYKVEHVVTDKFYENGDKFNKGKAINEGLKKLKRTDWIVHLDSDLILPANFRQICKEDQLQKDAIYGIDRVDVVGDEKIFELLTTKHSQISKWTYLDLSLNVQYHPTFRLHNLNRGYNTIGFFQLFYGPYLREKEPKFKPFEWYPIEHQDAARTDVGFQQKWDLNKRLLYPGIIGYHLMTEQSPKGTNWTGRQSRRLGQKEEGNYNYKYVPEYTDDVYQFTFNSTSY